jgi:hypothetical protein
MKLLVSRPALSLIPFLTLSCLGAVLLPLRWPGATAYFLILALILVITALIAYSAAVHQVRQLNSTQLTQSIPELHLALQHRFKRKESRVALISLTLAALGGVISVLLAPNSRIAVTTTSIGCFSLGTWCLRMIERTAFSIRRSGDEL